MAGLTVDPASVRVEFKTNIYFLPQMSQTQGADTPLFGQQGIVSGNVVDLNGTEQNYSGSSTAQTSNNDNIMSQLMATFSQFLNVIMQLVSALQGNKNTKIDSAASDKTTQDKITTDKTTTKETDETATDSTDEVEEVEEIEEVDGAEEINEEEDVEETSKPDNRESEIQTVAKAHMSHVLNVSKNTNNETEIRKSIMAGIDGIYEQYEDEPEIADEIFTEFIKMLDEQQGGYGKNSDKKIKFMNDGLIDKCILPKFQDEPARLMKILNNSEPTNEKAANTGENGNWADDSLNRKLRYELARDGHGNNGGRNPVLSVSKMIKEGQIQDMSVEELKIMAEFVYNTRKIEGEKWKIDSIKFEEQVKKLDLTDKQKHDIKMIAAMGN